MDQSRIDLFKQVLAMDPKDAVVRYGLGLEYAKVGMYAEAVNEFREAIASQPDYSAAYRELGQALTALGQTEDAVQVYTQGVCVAEQRGDLQTVKEMKVFMRRITGGQ